MRYSKAQKNSYKRGKRWGFAVMRAASQTSKGAVMAVDKAMTTCSKYARTGKRKGVVLTSVERSGYKGVADGIYEFACKYSKK